MIQDKNQIQGKLTHFDCGFIALPSSFILLHSSCMLPPLAQYSFSFASLRLIPFACGPHVSSWQGSIFNWILSLVTIDCRSTGSTGAQRSAHTDAVDNEMVTLPEKRVLHKKVTQGSYLYIARIISEHFKSYVTKISLKNGKKSEAKFGLKSH